jgi:hypothetical protein
MVLLLCAAAWSNLSQSEACMRTCMLTLVLHTISGLTHSPAHVSVGSSNTCLHACAYACIACFHTLFLPTSTRHQDVSVETDKQGRPRVRYEKQGTHALGQHLGCLQAACLQPDIRDNVSLPAQACIAACSLTPVKHNMYSSKCHSALAMHSLNCVLDSCCSSCRVELLGVARPQGALHHCRHPGRANHTAVPLQYCAPMTQVSLISLQHTTTNSQHVLQCIPSSATAST